MSALKILVALLVVLATPALAGESACVIAPTAPTRLQSADAVSEYRSVLKLCRGPEGERRVALREMTLDGEPALLLADPRTLATELDRSNCWRCAETEEAALADTRLMRSVEQSAEAPGLIKRGFLQNAGLTHGEGGGAFLTGDLCPSSHPLARSFLESLPAATPIALSISGLWLKHHFDDYRWLLQRQAAGGLAILWTNHSYHHPFVPGVAFDRNFLLTPGYDADEEILENERLLIANGQTPSLFFRFPGLISSAPLMQAARRHHLIALGADAWLALGERPRSGSIVLVHVNGNEPLGLKLFAREAASGALPEPLRPLTQAPP